MFSLFQPHTEWINEGKAGVPVEFGVRVAILEDQYGFILHHPVMEKETDEKVAVPLIQVAKVALPSLSACSFDKGFHSPFSQEELKRSLDQVFLPKKGSRTAAETEHETQPGIQGSKATAFSSRICH